MTAPLSDTERQAQQWLEMFDSAPSKAVVGAVEMLLADREALHTENEALKARNDSLYDEIDGFDKDLTKRGMRILALDAEVTRLRALLAEWEAVI